MEEGAGLPGAGDQGGPLPAAAGAMAPQGVLLDGESRN